MLDLIVSALVVILVAVPVFGILAPIVLAIVSTIIRVLADRGIGSE